MVPHKKCESVNALVVAEEAPGLGVDYILDHCMDSEEDIKIYGQWYNKMMHASERAMEVYSKLEGY
jgi:predicted TIM-barrel fold metal-dependent hydrolase